MTSTVVTSRTVPRSTTSPTPGLVPPKLPTFLYFSVTQDGLRVAVDGLQHELRDSRRHCPRRPSGSKSSAAMTGQLGRWCRRRLATTGSGGQRSRQPAMPTARTTPEGADRRRAAGIAVSWGCPVLPVVAGRRRWDGGEPLLVAPARTATNSSSSSSDSALAPSSGHRDLESAGGRGRQWRSYPGDRCRNARLGPVAVEPSPQVGDRAGRAEDQGQLGGQFGGRLDRGGVTPRLHREQPVDDLVQLREARPLRTSLGSGSRPSFSGTGCSPKAGSSGQRAIRQAYSSSPSARTSPASVAGSGVVQAGRVAEDLEVARVGDQHGGRVQLAVELALGVQPVDGVGDLPDSPRRSPLPSADLGAAASPGSDPRRTRRPQRHPQVARRAAPATLDWSLRSGTTTSRTRRKRASVAPAACRAERNTAAVRGAPEGSSCTSTGRPSTTSWPNHDWPDSAGRQQDAEPVPSGQYPTGAGIGTDGSGYSRITSGGGRRRSDLDEDAHSRRDRRSSG